MFKSKLLIAIFILTTGMLLAGCSISVSGEDLEFRVNDEIERSSDELTLNDVSAVSAVIKDTVGSVAVEYGKSSSVNIKIKYKVTGDREKELQEILEDVKVDAIVKNDELRVKVINSVTGEDMWDYIEEEYGGLDKPNLDVSLDIILPESIQEFDIKCDVGNIDLNSLAGEFDIISNVGNVKATNTNFTADSEITVDVGDINVSLSKELSAKSELAFTCNVGSIRIDTEGLPYTTKDAGGDNFVGSSETVLVNDVCSIDCTTSVGKLIMD